MHQHEAQNLTKQAILATRHCLTGCAIGEILGMVVAAATGLAAMPSVILSIGLAFLFGYGLTLTPILRTGMGLRRAIGLTLAADTASIATMEISDNAFILAVPGAIDATLTSPLFWVSLILSLAVAFVITVPVNRYLIGRGLGHAKVHALHEHH